MKPARAQEEAAKKNEPPTVRLEALTPTSGEGIETLFQETGEGAWRPQGDPTNEGFLLRPEGSNVIGSIDVKACADASKFTLQPYFNGSELKSVVVDGKAHRTATIVLPIDDEDPAPMRSMFLRILDGAHACLSQAKFFGYTINGSKGNPFRILPPRTVNAKVSASSTLAPEEAYAPDFLFDGRPEYGWVAGGGNNGVGESVTVTLDSPHEIVALLLWNGYQRSKDHFEKNARAKQLRVTLDDAPPFLLDVPATDWNANEDLSFPRDFTAKTIKIQIVEAIPGTKYKDLVLSELRFRDTKGVWGVDTNGMKERQNALAAAIHGRPLEKFLNRSWKSRCAPADRSNERQFRLRMNSTFVWYDTSPAAKEVSDGAWVARADDGAWSRIELFGRRNRVSTQWVPYEGSKKQQSVEEVHITGGVVSIASAAALGREAAVKLLKEWSTGPMKHSVRCLMTDKTDWAESAYQELEKGGAVFVRGAAMADLLAPSTR